MSTVEGIRNAGSLKRHAGEASSRMTLEDHLPQAREDRVITEAVSELKLFLDSHVDEFYLTRTPEPWSTDEQMTESSSEAKEEPEAGPSTGLAPAPLLPGANSNLVDQHSGLVDAVKDQQHDEREARKRKDDIYRSVAHVLINCIDPSGDETETFLPKEIVLFFHSIQKKDKPKPGQYFSMPPTPLPYTKTYSSPQFSTQQSRSGRF